MKRFILVLTLLAFCVVPSLADPVDLYRAGETARAFFRNDRNVALRMASLQQVPRAAAPLTKAAEERPPFYIFNRAGGGFVIVAADDACNPILAYSFTHPFGVGHDMPEGLKAWLDDLGLEVPTTLDELHDVLTAFKENDMSAKYYGNDAGRTTGRPAEMGSRVHPDQGRRWLFAGSPLRDADLGAGCSFQRPGAYD